MCISGHMINVKEHNALARQFEYFVSVSHVPKFDGLYCHTETVIMLVFACFYTWAIANFDWPNHHFSPTHTFKIVVKATTWLGSRPQPGLGSMPLQREFINFNSGIERNALNEKESSIWTIDLWLVDLLVADIHSSVMLSTSRTHAYGFTALGNRNTDLNNYRKKLKNTNWDKRNWTQLWLQTYLEALVWITVDISEHVHNASSFINCN